MPEYQDSDTIKELFTNISFTPGFGTTGRKVEIVKLECGYCGYDRAYCVTHENPEWGREYESMCANPACTDYDVPADVRGF